MTVQGIARTWNPIRKTLDVEVPDKDSFVRLKEEDISIYSTAKSGKNHTIPYEVFNLLGKPISLIQKSDGSFSHSTCMLNEFNALNVGDVIKATVIRITRISVLLKYKGLTLFIPFKEISDSRFYDAHEYFKLYHKVFVKVIQKSDPSSYIIVSYKRCFSDNLNNYNSYDIVIGKVTSEVTYFNDGLFIEISPRVSGIMNCNDPSMFKYGDKVRCRVRRVTPKGLKLDFLSFVQ